MTPNKMNDAEPALRADSASPLRKKNQFVFGASPALPEQEPLPEHEPLPEQEAFVPSVEAGAAEPAGAAPLAEQLAFAPAAAGSVAAGGALPPHPAATPNMIPETAESARTLPIFIVDSSVTCAALMSTAACGDVDWRFVGVRLFVSNRLCLRLKATKVSSKLASFFL